MRQWNTVASVAVTLTVLYVGIAAGALFMGKVDFTAFSSAVAPLLTAWGGYLAAIIKQGKPDE